MAEKEVLVKIFALCSDAMERLDKEQNAFTVKHIALTHIIMVQGVITGALKMGDVGDKNTSEETTLEVLKGLTLKLNELDEQDYFGTEGWRKFLGFGDN